MTATTPTNTDNGSGAAKAQDAAHAVQESGQAAAGSAADHARDLAGSASDKASQVVSEASDKAHDLLGDTRDQVRTEAESRRGQAVSSLRTLGDELDSMQKHDGDHGVATQLAGRGSSYVRQTGDWLDGRDPSQILDDVKGFARRRPGAFLLGAVVAGVVAGRLTRAVKAGAPDAGPTAAGQRTSSTTPGRPVVADTSLDPVSDRIATDLETPLPTYAGGTL